MAESARDKQDTAALVPVEQSAEPTEPKTVTRERAMNMGGAFTTPARRVTRVEMAGALALLDLEKERHVERVSREELADAVTRFLTREVAPDAG